MKIYISASWENALSLSGVPIKKKEVKVHLWADVMLDSIDDIISWLQYYI